MSTPVKDNIISTKSSNSSEFSPITLNIQSNQRSPRSVSGQSSTVSKAGSSTTATNTTSPSTYSSKGSKGSKGTTSTTRTSGNSITHGNSNGHAANKKHRKPFRFLRKKNRRKTPQSPSIKEGGEEGYTQDPYDSYYSNVTLSPENRPKSRRDLRLEEFSDLLTHFPSCDAQNTSLHVACQEGYSTDLIVRYVLKKDVEAAKKVNSRGDLPLHCAMRYKSTSDEQGDDDDDDGAAETKREQGIEDGVVEALLMEYPEAVEQANEDKCLPIHILCENGIPNTHAFYSLLRAYPEALDESCSLSVPFDSEARNHISSKDGNVQDETGIWCWIPYFLSSDDSSSKNKGPNYDPAKESELTPLHLAILHHAKPDCIQFLLNMDQSSLLSETDQDRTALDIAKYMVLNEVLTDETPTPLKHTFAAIEIMQSVERNMQRKARLIRMTTMKRDELVARQFDAKKEWRKVANVVIFANLAAKSIDHDDEVMELLGPVVEQDGEEVVDVPEGFVLPDTLEHVCVDIELPVGFRRLRWALLSSQSDFLLKGLLEEKMNYTKLIAEPWDKHNDEIGSHCLPSDTTNNFANATRKIQYLFPKSGIVGANMVYEEMSLLYYDEYCFVIKKVSRNPEVPFGKKFSTHTLMVFINCGNHSCKMIASSEAVFEGKPPMIAWKIRNGVYNGTTDYFVAKGEVICEQVSCVC